MIRCADPGDVPAMHAVYRNSLRGEPQERNFLRLVRRFPQLCCVASRGPAIVGYAIGRIHRGFLTRRDAAFLFSVAVVGAARGEGVGRALVQYFVDCGQSLGLAELDLEVERDNAAAGALYESFGLSTIESPPTGKPRTRFMAGKL